MEKLEENKETIKTPLVDKYRGDILTVQNDNFVGLVKKIKQGEEGIIEEEHEEKDESKIGSMGNGWTELMTEVSETLDNLETQKVFNKITSIAENQIDDLVKKQPWAPGPTDSLVPAEAIKKLADDILIVYRTMEDDFGRKYMEGKKLPDNVEEDREKLWHFQEQLHKIREGYLEKLERVERSLEKSGHHTELEKTRKAYKGPWLEKTLLTKQGTENRSIFK